MEPQNLRYEIENKDLFWISFLSNFKIIPYASTTNKEILISNLIILYVYINSL